MMGINLRYPKDLTSSCVLVNSVLVLDNSSDANVMFCFLIAPMATFACTYVTFACLYTLRPGRTIPKIENSIRKTNTPIRIIIPLPIFFDFLFAFIFTCGRVFFWEGGVGILLFKSIFSNPSIDFIILKYIHVCQIILLQRTFA